MHSAHVHLHPQRQTDKSTVYSHQNVKVSFRSRSTVFSWFYKRVQPHNPYVRISIDFTLYSTSNEMKSSMVWILIRIIQQCCVIFPLETIIIKNKNIKNICFLVHRMWLLGLQPLCLASMRYRRHPTKKTSIVIENKSKCLLATHKSCITS